MIVCVHVTKQDKVCKKRQLLFQKRKEMLCHNPPLKQDHKKNVHVNMNSVITVKSRPNLEQDRDGVKQTAAALRGSSCFMQTSFLWSPNLTFTQTSAIFWCISNKYTDRLSNWCEIYICMWFRVMFGFTAENTCNLHGALLPPPSWPSGWRKITSF